MSMMSHILSLVCKMRSVVMTVCGLSKRKNDAYKLLTAYLIWAAVVHPVLSMAVKATGASETNIRQMVNLQYI